MSKSPTPAGSGPRATGNPAVSGSGTGMGADGAAGPDVVGGVQAGMVNDAAQGSRASRAGDPSLGSGMVVPEPGNRMGDAAAGGARAGVAAPVEPFELPYKVVTPPHPGR
ncbi:MAG: hypothetical protein HOQ10_09670 [Frateuria sp.]|uniref:hypothetical protein n=1 Tax=Frateuria sp. TaxID=2211372 RepID=UPI0017AF10BD|nr:hypothetical protein [Frateuria sp.]NUO72968.1 hypothetical protein [Frateuria sp.]NUR23176.1 hypothetical protein [Frateuria sp.]